MSHAHDAHPAYAWVLETNDPARQVVIYPGEWGIEIERARTRCNLAQTLLAALVLSICTSARAACPGDTNGDRVVTIDEIISAVNAALYGCEPPPTPTPTSAPVGCPVPFDRDTRADAEVCNYNGYATVGVLLGAIWAGDGSHACITYMLGTAGYVWCGYVIDSNRVTLAAMYEPGRAPVNAAGVMRLRSGPITALDVEHYSPDFVLPRYGTLRGYLGNLTTTPLPSTNGYVVALRHSLAHFRALTQ